MFLTADTHFGHRLMASMRGFGDDVAAHDEALIKAWNRVVTNPRCPVWHLGDFAMGQDYLRALSIFERLNGRKTLVRATTTAPWSSGCPGTTSWTRPSSVTDDAA